MPSSREEQILEAARECFARFGYKKTTLDDIGKKIGLNKASIYYYFKTKEDIFTKIVLSEFQQFITQLQKDISEDLDCDQKILKYFVKRQHHWSQANVLLSQITEIEPEEAQLLMASGIELYSKIESGEKSFLAEILQDCIKNGHIKKCDVVKISGYIFALVEGIKEGYMGRTRSYVLSSTDHKDMERDVRMALTIFLDGLRVERSI